MELPREIEYSIIKCYLNSLSQEELVQRQCSLNKHYYQILIKPMIYRMLILGDFKDDFKNLLAWKLHTNYDNKPIRIYDIDKFMQQLGHSGHIIKYFEKMDSYMDQQQDHNSLSIIYQLILKNCKNLETIKYKFDKNDNCIYYLNNNVNLKNIFINCAYNLLGYDSNNNSDNSNSNKVFFQNLKSIDCNLLKNAYDFQLTKDLENLKYFKLYTTFTKLPEKKPIIDRHADLIRNRQLRRERDYTMLFDKDFHGRSPAINIFLKNLIDKKIIKFNKLKYLKFDNMSIDEKSVILILKTFLQKYNKIQIFEFNNVIEHPYVPPVGEERTEMEEEENAGQNSVLELISWKKFHNLERLVLNIDTCKPMINYILKRVLNTTGKNVNLQYLEISFYDLELPIDYITYIHETFQILQKIGNFHKELTEVVINVHGKYSMNDELKNQLMQYMVNNVPVAVKDFKITMKSTMQVTQLPTQLANNKTCSMQSNEDMITVLIN